MVEPPYLKPNLVRYSTHLLWASLILGVFLQLMYTGWDIRATFRVFVGGLILVLAINAYLIVGISRGRRFAPCIYLAMFVGGLYFAPLSVENFANEPYVVGAEVMQVFVQAVALIMLFIHVVSRWKRPRTTETI